jgi:branched-chain amino acid transport system permease protein
METPLLESLVDGLAEGAIYGLIGLGFALIFAVTGIFHIAHAGVVALAGGLCALFLREGGLDPHAAIILGLVGGTLAGVLMGRVYGALPSRDGLHPSATLPTLFVSLGLYAVTVHGLGLLLGNEHRPLPLGGNDPLHSSLVHTAAFFALGGAVLLLAFLYQGTRFGGAVRALAGNPAYAGNMGTSLGRVKLGVFALGSLLASGGGVLIAYHEGVYFQAGLSAFLYGAMAALVGGVGRLLAPALGALLLGVILGALEAFVPAQWSGVLVPVLFLLFLAARPRGLAGLPQRLED